MHAHLSGSSMDSATRNVSPNARVETAGIVICTYTGNHFCVFDFNADTRKRFPCSSCTPLAIVSLHGETDFDDFAACHLMATFPFCSLFLSTKMPIQCVRLWQLH